jgi:hypothetical protein
MIKDPKPAGLDSIVTPKISWAFSISIERGSLDLGVVLGVSSTIATIRVLSPVIFPCASVRVQVLSEPASPTSFSKTSFRFLSPPE